VKINWSKKAGWAISPGAACIVHMFQAEVGCLLQATFQCCLYINQPGETETAFPSGAKGKFAVHYNMTAPPGSRPSRLTVQCKRFEFLKLGVPLL
jgi:hypothetical protein